MVILEAIMLQKDNLIEVRSLATYLSLRENRLFIFFSHYSYFSLSSPYPYNLSQLFIVGLITD